jgi:glycosylphosphatidylinositol transamidase
VLLLAGFIYIFAIPLPQLGKGTYVSENALQPAQVRPHSGLVDILTVVQVNVYWSWPEVQKSDHFARQVESWSTLSSIE